VKKQQKKKKEVSGKKKYNNPDAEILVGGRDWAKLESRPRNVQKERGNLRDQRGGRYRPLGLGARRRGTQIGTKVVKFFKKLSDDRENKFP